MSVGHHASIFSKVFQNVGMLPHHYKVHDLNLQRCEKLKFRKEGNGPFLNKIKENSRSIYIYTL